MKAETKIKINKSTKSVKKCPAFTGIPDCECAGTPQWKDSCGGKVKIWCESGTCPKVHGGKCKRDEPKKLKKIIKHKLLMGFVRDECANYDKHYQTCLDDKPCKVLDGQRCGYFEKAVLGPPGYKYKLPGYDYAKLFGQYAEQTGAQKQSVKVRRCGCGTPLRHRQRFCERCVKIRAKVGNRQRQRNYRLSNSVVVTV